MNYVQYTMPETMKKCKSKSTVAGAPKMTYRQFLQGKKLSSFGIFLWQLPYPSTHVAPV